MFKWVGEWLTGQWARFSLRRTGHILGVLFVPLMAMMLAISEMQDYALKVQQDATELFGWMAGVPIVRYGRVHSYPRPGCMRLHLNDPFPLGNYPVLCGDMIPVGTKFRAIVKGRGISSLEIMGEGEEK